ncbi:MAG: site-specific DNA-methyltransferase [Rhodobacteraceae bacterium]|nr:site-specific DNA-methyltransferase [Paracoccaceae bacterium]
MNSLFDVQTEIQTGKIYNECCLDTMSQIRDRFVDLVITSPPYDEMRQYSGNDFFQFEDIAHELFRIVKDGGVLVWVIGDQTIQGNETGTSFRHALYFRDEVGFNLFDTMIYVKPPRGAVGNNKTYWQSFEYMFVLSKGKPKTINLIYDRPNKESRKGDKGTKRLANGRLLNLQRTGYGKFGRRTNVWEFMTGKNHSTKDQIAFQHPAIFPEQLAHDHIITWSDPNDIVYDPFMGSGTTAKMAILTYRRWIGSEICKDYCRLAEERISNAM